MLPNIKSQQVLGCDVLRYVARLAASRHGLAMVCGVMVELSGSLPGAASLAHGGGNFFLHQLRGPVQAGAAHQDFHAMFS